MKITHIVLIIAIALSIGMIISMTGDASQYVSFEEALDLSAKGDLSKVHVVGELKKDAQGQILGMEYAPEKDPNYFSFVLKDTKGREQRVIYFSPKPADFERSEQIVIIGNMQKNKFIAEKILMKCPSKYQEGEIEVKEAVAGQ